MRNLYATLGDPVAFLFVVRPAATQSLRDETEWNSNTQHKVTLPSYASFSTICFLYTSYVFHL